MGRKKPIITIMSKYTKDMCTRKWLYMQYASLNVDESRSRCVNSTRGFLSKRKMPFGTPFEEQNNHSVYIGLRPSIYPAQEVNHQYASTLHLWFVIKSPKDVEMERRCTAKMERALATRTSTEIMGKQSYYQYLNIEYLYNLDKRFYTTLTKQ